MAEVLQKTVESEVGTIKISVDESLSNKINAVKALTGVLSGDTSIASVTSVIASVAMFIPALAPMGMAIGLIGSFFGGGGLSPMEVVSDQLGQISGQINAIANQISISTQAIIQTVKAESEAEKVLIPIITNIINDNIKTSNQNINKFENDINNEIKNYQQYTKEKLLNIQVEKNTAKLEYENQKKKLAEMLRPVLQDGLGILESSISNDVEKLKELDRIQKEIDELNEFDIVGFIRPLVQKIKSYYV